MRHHLTVRGSLDAEEVRRWLARPLQRLRRRLVRFPPDAVYLRTHVRDVEGRSAEAAVTLRLPSATLATHEEGVDAQGALREAYEELERRLEKEKARLRRSRRWRRSTRAFQEELLDRMARQSQRELPISQAEELLRNLQEAERFVRRELRWLEASGELASGEVDPRDVIDTAFLQILARTGGPPTREHLLQGAAAALRAEVDRVRRTRQEIHIEEDAVEAAPDRVATLGSGILDFYPSEDELRVEDVVAGLGETPEEIETTVELAAALQTALAALPARWRQALLLRQVEQLDDAEVARALDVATEEIRPLLTHARAFLRGRLAETGLLDPGTANDAA